MMGFKRKAKVALPTDVIDVRIYQIVGETGHAYIGTESGPGSHELVLHADADLAKRAKPYISQGVLYGLMLDTRLVLD